MSVDTIEDTSKLTKTDEPGATGDHENLPQILAEVAATLAPLWPLADYVAVNPFLGLSNRRFLDARRTLCEVRDCEVLPSLDYFRELFQRREITTADVEAAYRQCAGEYPELYAGGELIDVIHAMDAPEPAGPGSERRYFTVSELVDQRDGSSWTSHIINDISRHCAAHYDEGEATWPSPWRHLPLFDAWREAARLGHRMNRLGMRGFREFVARLPESASAAVLLCLEELQIPSNRWRGFLLCEMLSVAGWAAFLKYRAAGADPAVGHDDDLVGLLAARLSYDVVLARTRGASALLEVVGEVPAGPGEVLVRYTLQVAAEAAYRRQLCESLARRGHAEPDTDRKTLQMVFCIDVRSEVFRRHLETVSGTAQTFGFAGFFGMALEYVPLGATAGPAHCPVLLSPAFRVHETLLGADEKARSRAAGQRRLLRTGRKLWKSFRKRSQIFR